MKRVTSIIVLLLSLAIFIEAQTLSGKWISHQFPATQFSPPLIRCGGTVGIFTHSTGIISIFDANIGKWTDKKLKAGENVLESYATGNTAFAYTNDSLLIAYSSLTHNLDTIKFEGRTLKDPQLWSCGANLVVFATTWFMYVFDAFYGSWQVINISLPAQYPFVSARCVLGTDYALLILYHINTEIRKHYVYSLHHHSFNQLEYAFLPNEMMDHGYAGSITTENNSKKLIGYSSITNQYSEIEAPFGLGLHEEIGPHHWGGSVYGYVYATEIVPNYQWRTYIYVYSTLSGQWFNAVFDHLPKISYGGLHVGSEYAQLLKVDEIDLNLFQSDPLTWSSYFNLFTQFYTDFRSIPGTIYPPSGVVLGKNVLGLIHSNKAWGYNALTNLDALCTIEGSINSLNSNIFEGADYIAFGRYVSNKDSMDIYIFSGNSWHHLSCGNNGTGTISIGTDKLYAIYSSYKNLPNNRNEIIVYSKELDYIITYPLAYLNNYLSSYAKGCMLEMNTSEGNFIFDSQTLIPYQFNFQLYSNWISDSIAVLYDNTAHQLYGYSTKTKSWANFNATANINFNDIGTNVGLLTAGNNREKIYAYNGIYNCWVPLLPESKSFAYDAGDNFAVVFKEGMAYAFYTEKNGPAIVSTALISNANAGSQILNVLSSDGFTVGDSIIINPGGPNEEINKIVGFGSIQLQSPLQFDHFIGEQVVKFNITSVEEKNENVPARFELYQSYPNPFNPSTKIRFSIPNVGTGLALSVLKVYDILGNEVATLVNEYKPAGSYEVEFHSAVGGRQLASGVYFYQLKTGDYIQTKKMILLR